MPGRSRLMTCAGSALASRVMVSPIRLEDFEVVELHQTQDPEVVIVEMRTKGP
jgi:hypothetical protein